MNVLEADLAPGQWEMAIPHLPLVRMCAKRYPSHLIDDAVADGILGLLRAVQKYDPGRGTEFSAFAVPVITSAIIAGRRNAHRGLWRHRQRSGDAFEPPCSIDQIDPRHTAADHVENDALANLFAAEAERVLRRACADDLDHRIVDALIGPNFTFRDQLARDLTPGSGLTFHGVQYRIKRLQRVARDRLR